MWSTSRQINYGLPPEMGMVGVRDVFVVAPASSFHPQQPESVVSADPHSLGVGVGVIPLLAATPCLAPANVGVGVGIEDESNNSNNNLLTMASNRGRTAGGRIQFWQNQPSNYNLKKPVNVSFDHGNSQGFLYGGGGGGGGGGLSASSSAMTCQDCGNQAKKDCAHRRCRTCCKSRGFDCVTHVKSTWVPAARRRERQLLAAAAVAGGGGAGSSGSTSASKKPRLLTSQTATTSHTSTSNTTPRSFDTSSSHQELDYVDASFKEPLPGQVRAPAVFKCVRVTSVEDGEDEYAYQAVVKIGGHVFKGFLYKQGMEARDAFPDISELHLGGNNNSDFGGRNVASSSSPILDPSDVYATSGGGGGGGLLGGGSNYEGRGGTRFS
ncbi:hypothetical protein RJ641_033966 [Dillenia turbinata]|uniref:Uncharacterized protein n=1 Tax=Dillenia turbinata TaxID=194707 RepID=A0AAN8VVN9_9MAGN